MLEILNAFHFTYRLSASFPSGLRRHIPRHFINEVMDIIMDVSRSIFPIKLNASDDLGHEPDMVYLPPPGGVL